MTTFIFKCHSIYRAPGYSDQAYRDAAIPFGAVMKLKVKGKRPFEESYGTGSYVEDPATGKRFILTAAHVVKPDHDVYLESPHGDILLEKIHYFPSDLQQHYKARKVALSFANPIRHERLYGGRMETETTLKAIAYYGGDLAVAFLPPHVTLPIKPLRLSVNRSSVSQGTPWVVGFGASGVIGSIGGWTGDVYGAGKKRAYTPDLQAGIIIKLIDFEQGEEIIHPSWMEIALPKNGKPLPGQVGYGDSGGPVLWETGEDTYEIIGVVTSVLPAAKSKTFLQQATVWQKFILKIGQRLEPKSWGAYMFGQEANTYGSEALFSGVTSPLVHDWIKRTLEDIP